MADHRKGARFGRGCADPHDHPPGDEDVSGRGHRGNDRAGTEDSHSEQDHFLAPEKVTDRAEAQHEAGEGEGIAIHHPLQLAHGGVQVALHMGQHDGHNRVVEEGQEEDEEKDGQG